MKKAAEDFQKEMDTSPFRGARGVNKDDAEAATKSGAEADESPEAITDFRDTEDAVSID